MSRTTGEIATLERSVRNDAQRLKRDLSAMRRAARGAITSPAMFGVALAGGALLARRSSGDERRAERRRRRVHPRNMLRSVVGFIQKVLVPLFVAEGLAEGAVSGFAEDTKSRGRGTHG
jgi:hypothetical protein